MLHSISTSDPSREKRRGDMETWSKGASLTHQAWERQHFFQQLYYIRCHAIFLSLFWIFKFGPKMYDSKIYLLKKILCLNKWNTVNRTLNSISNHHAQLHIIIVKCYRYRIKGTVTGLLVFVYMNLSYVKKKLREFPSWLSG